MRSGDYRERFYRQWQKPVDLLSFSVKQGETDLQIFAKKDLTQRAKSLVNKFRGQIEQTIHLFPPFLTSLRPIVYTSQFEIIEKMVQNAAAAGVGPMAGVAGAIAEFVGQSLLAHSSEIIVENGGDIFMKTDTDRMLLVYAGEDSPFRNRLRIMLRGRQRERGVCTSSRRIGHSLSFGNTDAVVVLADSAITADVFATAIGNIVKTVDDIPAAMEYAQNNTCINGGLILIGDRLGAWGEIELVE